jgi:NADH dehydrogenase FAD-containing subunit
MPPHLLLLGPGHAHLFVLEALARGRMPAVQATLVVPEARLLCPGMLAGLVEGRYGLAESTIDLEALCRQAGVALCLGEVVRVDPGAGTAHLGDGTLLIGEVVSLAPAGEPHGVKLPGVAHYASIPCTAGPAAELAARLDRLAAEVRPEPRRLIVAGAGSRGIELALAARARLDRLAASDVIITLFDGRADLFGGRLPARADLVERVLAAHDISLRVGTAVSEVGPDFVRLSDGRVLPADLVVWATGKDVPPVFRASSLAADARGHALVDDTLQVRGHPALFAAGDGVLLADQPGTGLAAGRLRCGAREGRCGGSAPARSDSTCSTPARDGRCCSTDRWRWSRTGRCGSRRDVTGALWPASSASGVEP